VVNGIFQKPKTVTGGRPTPPEFHPINAATTYTDGSRTGPTPPKPPINRVDPGPTKPPPKSREELEAERRASLEAEHRSFLAKYLNSAVPRDQAVHTIAVAVVCGSNDFDRPLADAIINRCQQENSNFLPDLFTHEFISAGFFDAAFGGRTEIERKLDLASFADTLLLGREAIRYSKSPGLQNLITAHIDLEVKSVPMTARGYSQRWMFNANGPGFSDGQALAAAEERIMKQITRTNFSLVPFPTGQQRQSN